MKAELGLLAYYSEMTPKNELEATKRVCATIHTLHKLHKLQMLGLLHGFAEGYEGTVPAVMKGLKGTMKGR